MDGALMATIISSSVVVGGAIGTGFWRVALKIGDQSKSIGRLEGKVDGLGIRMDSYDKQMDSFGKRMEGFDKRIDRLDKRMNGFINSHSGKEEK